MWLPGDPAHLGRAAADPLGAGGERVVDQLVDDGGLLGRDHRADLGRPALRVAEDEALGRRPDAGDEAVGDVRDDVDALDPRAGLSGVREAGPGDPVDRVVELGVGADDRRVLAAELEDRPLHLRRAGRADRVAGRDRPGEEDLADARVDDGPADVAAAVQDPNEPLGDSGLHEREANAIAEQRRQLRRLQDDAVAGHQRDRDLAEGDRPGVVPGGDHGDDSERLEAELRPLAEEQTAAHLDLLLGEDPGPLLGDPVQPVDRRHHLHRVGLGDRLALLARQQPGDLVEVAGEDLGGAAQVATAIGQRQLAPERLDRGDLVDRRLHVLGIDGRDRAEQLAGRGIERIEARHLGSAYWRGPRLPGPAAVPAAGPPAYSRRSRSRRSRSVSSASKPRSVGS